MEWLIIGGVVGLLQALVLQQRTPAPDAVPGARFAALRIAALITTNAPMFWFVARLVGG